jgi:hypothetical protein
MKKHYIIIGIVLVSALFFIPSLIMKYNQSNAGSDGDENPTTLNARIEEIGQNPWDQSNYDALIGEIDGLASDQQISASERDSYRSTLNINMQKALAMSYKKALTESCYASNMDFKIASDTISNPILELSKQKNTYRKYKYVIGFKSNLYNFLSKKYSELEAENLINNYRNAYAGELFQSCSAIQNLKNEIAQKVAKLRSFDAYYKIKILNKEFPETFYYSDNENRMAELKAYSYYYQDFLTRQ